MRHRLHTEIDIAAAPEIVWDILTELDRYPDWNPFIVSAAGELVVGERLKNRLHPPGGKAMTFTPTLTIVEPSRTLEWLGHLGVRGIFDGRHRFELVATPDGTRLVQREEFSGALVRLMRRSLDDTTAEGFSQMNLALKSRAEARAALTPRV